MKSIKSISLFLLTAFILGACSTSNNVVSNRMIQKRKYNKGFHLNKKKNYQSVVDKESKTYKASNDDLAIESNNSRKVNRLTQAEKALVKEKLKYAAQPQRFMKDKLASAFSDKKTSSEVVESSINGPTESNSNRLVQEQSGSRHSMSSPSARSSDNTMNIIALVVLIILIIILFTLLDELLGGILGWILRVLILILIIWFILRLLGVL